MTKEDRIRAWEQHLSDAKRREEYAFKRIDLMIISISGACIYIVFEILRFLNSTNSVDIETNIPLLKSSAILAVAAITCNFLSQIFGYRANRFEKLFSRLTINNLDEGIENDPKLDELDRKGEVNNRLTRSTNYISTILMALAIIILVIYNLISF